MSHRSLRLLFFGLTVLGLSSCGAGNSGSGAADSGATVKLQGAGASFPAPLYTNGSKRTAAAIRAFRSIISRSGAAAESRASSIRQWISGPATPP